MTYEEFKRLAEHPQHRDLRFHRGDIVEVYHGDEVKMVLVARGSGCLLESYNAKSRKNNWPNYGAKQCQITEK